MFDGRDRDNLLERGKGVLFFFFGGDMDGLWKERWFQGRRGIGMWIRERWNRNGGEKTGVRNDKMWILFSRMKKP